MFSRRQFLKIIAALPFVKLLKFEPVAKTIHRKPPLLDNLGGYLVPHEYAEKLRWLSESQEAIVWYPMDDDPHPNCRCVIAESLTNTT